MANGETIETYEPKPDPWAPPGANYLQAGSAAVGITGLGLMAGDQTGPGIPEAIAWLPDPNHIFTGVANILGFNLNREDLFSWGFVLVVLSVALNLASLWLRYRHAAYVGPRWATQDKALVATLQRQKAAQPTRTQGVGGGAA